MGPGRLREKHDPSLWFCSVRHRSRTSHADNVHRTDTRPRKAPMKFSTLFFVLASAAAALAAPTDIARNALEAPEWKRGDPHQAPGW
ncbi:hypothetical protein K503DRAFT_366632 [Rhizopogon vinicolor AM-OR11-026]|uniref:Uncharacterized protein n=1 Tax=Rhizopogon vinicolor AM-OR11-026 TaxID=1314800 RepID=A0A1B7MSA5_9AGAM|nr:hypothetical protein K503DRAFT_366632 [Rhizopogon vinicolor AM-OR11-026]